MAALVANMAGFEIGEEEIGAIINQGIALIGAVMAIYGRVTAKTVIS